MIATRDAARAFLADFERTAPGAFTLARAVSLAARVEPELLRAARLRLFPQLTAGDEADFWFSECVESPGSLWVMFAPAVAEELRVDLAARCSRESVQQARDLVVQMHADAAPLVKVEETIHWLSLGGIARRQSVEAQLQPILKAVRQRDDAGVAQWAARTIPRFSSWVRDLPMAWAIRVVAEQRVGGTIVLDPRARSMPAEAAAILRDLLPTTEVWVRLGKDVMELSRERLLGGHRIVAPETSPIVLTVTQPDHVQDVELRGPMQRVKVAPGPVRIRTMTGASWSLEATDDQLKSYVSFRFGRPDFLSSRHHLEFIAEEEEIPKDVPAIIVPRLGEQWAKVADLQRKTFGSRPYVMGARPWNFAATIEVDGALIGIVGLGNTTIDSEQLRDVCGGSPEEWIARHHASILVLPEDLSDKVFQGGVEKWGFSLVMRLGLGLVPFRENPVIVSIDLKDPFSGELKIGAESKLYLHSGFMEREVPVPMNLHPLTIEVREPDRWVLIAGSSHGLDPYVVDITREVGRQLAREGLGLITGGWLGVDEIMTLAYADALKGRGAATVTRSIQHVLGTIEPRAEIPGSRALFGDGDSAGAESVRRADALMVIGGYSSTMWMVDEARKQQKPIVPIAQTGGVAQLLGGPRSKSLKKFDAAAVARAAVAALLAAIGVPAEPPAPKRKQARKKTSRVIRKVARGSKVKSSSSRRMKLGGGMKLSRKK